MDISVVVNLLILLATLIILCFAFLQAKSSKESAITAKKYADTASRHADIAKQKLWEEYIENGKNYFVEKGNLDGYLDSLPLSPEEKENLVRTIFTRVGKSEEWVKKHLEKRANNP